MNKIFLILTVFVLFSCKKNECDKYIEFSCDECGQITKEKIKKQISFDRGNKNYCKNHFAYLGSPGVFDSEKCSENPYDYTVDHQKEICVHIKKYVDELKEREGPKSEEICFNERKYLEEKGFLGIRLFECNSK